MLGAIGCPLGPPGLDLPCLCHFVDAVGYEYDVSLETWFLNVEFTVGRHRPHMPHGTMMTISYVFKVPPAKMYVVTLGKRSRDDSDADILWKMSGSHRGKMSHEGEPSLRSPGHH